MNLYWKQFKRGIRLILDDEGVQEEVGGVRQTKRGFDAFAKTFGYDPGRAQKGIASMDEARDFVEAFRPWELYEGAAGLAVESDIRSPDESP